MAQIKKISTKTVFGDVQIEALVEHHKKNGADVSMPMMRVLGQAVGLKHGTSAYGPWTALIGRFKATNLQTGETMESSQCFLPEIALVQIQLALANSQAAGGGAVLFGVDVSVSMIPLEKRKPGGVPYEYSFDPLSEPSPDDPILALESQIQAGPKALQLAAHAPAAGTPPPPAANRAPTPAAKRAR